MTETKETPETAPLPSAAARGKLVTIFIGPTKVPYALHKDLICHHSEYFRAACNGNWSEADEGLVLEDVEPEVFNLFLHWLYKQDLPTEYKSLCHAAGAVVEDGIWFFKADTLLVKSCVFGDRFLAPRFKQKAHNLFITEGGNRSNELIRYAYENLPEDDKLLKFFVDLQCIEWDPIEDENNPAEMSQRHLLPNTFLVQVMIRYQQLKEKPMTDSDIKYCSYHYHDSEEEQEHA